MRDWVAGEAVACELVFVHDSLLRGKIQGNLCSMPRQANKALAITSVFNELPSNSLRIGTGNSLAEHRIANSLAGRDRAALPLAIVSRLVKGASEESKDHDQG